MPYYTFLCQNCERDEDMYFRMADVQQTIRCSECGGDMKRMFYAPQISVRQPYVTSHITGDPVEITSAKQEKELCEAHGVTRLMDSESSHIKKPKKTMPTIGQQYQELGRIAVTSK
jgi:putative FmdB family regulatory protein